MTCQYDVQSARMTDEPRGLIHENLKESE